MFSPSFGSMLREIVFTMLLIGLAICIFPLVSVIVFPITLKALVLAITLFPVRAKFTAAMAFTGSFAFAFVVPITLFTLYMSSPL